jgi:hypothetical protein
MSKVRVGSFVLSITSPFFGIIAMLMSSPLWSFLLFARTLFVLNRCRLVREPFFVVKKQRGRILPRFLHSCYSRRDSLGRSHSHRPIHTLPGGCLFIVRLGQIMIGSLRRIANLPRWEAGVDACALLYLKYNSPQVPVPRLAKVLRTDFSPLPSSQSIGSCRVPFVQMPCLQVLHSFRIHFRADLVSIWVLSLDRRSILVQSLYPFRSHFQGDFVRHEPRHSGTKRFLNRKIPEQNNS